MRESGRADAGETEARPAPKVIDFHTHAFPPWLRDRRVRYLEIDATFSALFGNRKARMATADELVEAMDADGVDASVVMGMGWTDHGLAEEINDYLAESVRRYPGRLYGFGGVNPAWGERAAREAERCAAAGLLGVGELHPDTQGYDIGDKRTMAPLMETAKRLGLIVTTHSSEPVGHTYPGKGATWPDSLWRFILAFPEVDIVCAHWGGGLPFYALMPEVEESLSNVYFDSAASPFLYSASVFPTVAGLVGAGRVLLGSDYPLLPARRLIDEARQTVASHDDLAAILGGNAERLLARGGAGGRSASLSRRGDGDAGDTQGMS